MRNEKLQQNIEDVYPMSDIEKGMVFYSQKESSLYHNQTVYQLNMNLHEGRFRKAVELMVEKHPILRTTFNLYDFDEPIQIVHRNIPLDIKHYDLSGRNNTQQEKDIAKFMAEDLKQPFTFAVGEPLWRIKTFSLGNGNIFFLWVCHHSIIDGWSSASLLTELNNTYLTLKSNPGFVPGKLKSTYKDFIVSQIMEKKNTKTAEFWKNELQGYKRLEFPQMSKNRDQIYNIKPKKKKLGQRLFVSLTDTAATFGTSLQNVCFAAYLYMINMLSRENDIVVGQVSNNRPQCKDGDKIVGCFLNTVPVRMKIPVRIQASDYIREVDKKLVQLKQYDRLPFRDIVKIVGEKTGDKNPLLDTIFNFTDFHIYTRAIKEINPAEGPVDNSLDMPSESDGAAAVNTLLNLDVSATMGDLSASLTFSTAIITPGMADNLLTYFEKVLHKFAYEPGSILAKSEIISTQEKQNLLYRFNDTRQDFPGDKTLHRLFEEQVERTPGRTAVTAYGKDTDSSGPPEVLTYRELNEKSNRLAYRLQTKGIGPDSVVGIMTERSAGMMIGLMAILKAGGAYMPVDPDYPQARIDYLLADSNAAILLRGHSQADKKIIWQGETIFLEEAVREAKEENETRVQSAANPGSLAYVIYTSGSTGKPKGAMIEHHSAVNRLNWMQRFYPIFEQDVILQKTPFIFDVSVWELFWWSLEGAAVCFLEPGAEKSPEKLIEAIENNKITTIHFVPSMLNAFLTYLDNTVDLKKLAGLRQVFASGEALKVKHVDQFNASLKETNGTALINLYGPTEATVDVSYFNCSGVKTGDLDSIPIGKPIDNINLFILDNHRELLPIGVSGELYIAGVGLARGYLCRPELTDRTFVSSPLPGFERLYRTGDLARWLPDGNIEFLGRIDHQVKIRGYRIELGEIENQLLKIEGIKEAVVLVNGKDKENLHLYAYYTAEKEFESSALKDILSKELPDYEVPAHLLKLDQMPLLPNGKIDRRGFPEPEAPDVSEDFVAPRTQDEKTIAGIWSRVLNVEKVGIHDNFFALGGDSISSIQVVARAREAGLHFSTQQLFQFPTVNGLIDNMKEKGNVDDTRATPRNVLPFDLISTEDRAKIPDGVEDAYPLTMLQAGLIFQSELIRGTSMYHDILTLTLKGRFDRRLFAQAVQRIVDHHPIVRTTYDLNNYSQYLQLVYKTIPIPLQVEDISGLSFEEQMKIVDEFVKNEKQRQFDWGQPGLIRFYIHILSEDVYQYTFSFHDSTLDGWSLSSLKTELFLTYSSLLKGDESVLEAVPSDGDQVSFRDYVALEREVIESGEGKEYWNQLLADSTFTEVPRWPLARPDSETFKVIVHPVPLAPGLSAEIKVLAQSLKVPVKSVLLAAHCRVLGMLSGNSDILTGYEHSGRPEEKGGETILGLFLNTLPFRLLLPEGSWADLIRETYNAEIGFLPFRRYPMALMKQELQKAREALFETVFNFTHFYVLKGLQKLDSLDVLKGNTVLETEYVLRAEFSQNAFTDDVELTLHYHAHVFGNGQISAIASYYARTLQLMCRDSSARCASQSLLSEEERKQLLEDFNRTQTDYPADKCVHELFQMQAERTPRAPAAACGEEELSYEELNLQANRLARRLLKLGVSAEQETIAAVVMERGIELLISMLAIFKAGGVYLPLDPHDPAERIEKILEQAGCRLVLTVNEFVSLQAGQHRDVMPVDAVLKEEGHETGDNIPLRSTPQNLAYVIYTSGSTGLPKGAMIEHRGMVNHLYAKIHDLKLTETDIIAQTASQCFDISIWQFLVALIAGAKTAIYPNHLILDPEQTMDRVTGDGVTILEVVPSYLAVLLGVMATKSIQFNALRYLMATGETLKPELVKQWLEKYPHIPIVNAYGPTEASDDITHYVASEPPAAEYARIPIGKPLQNLSIYIVDSHMQLCPIGVKGEICVSGIGVGRGYLKDEERTAQVFMRDPFARDKAVRLYKTGDLGCWLPDGNIDFFGRKDDQVKIRGFRIELGEIENKMLEHPDIQEAAAIVRQEKNGDKRICAYFVPYKEPLSPGLKEYLALELPDYMIPSYFVKLEQIPVTRSGKVDKKRLPAPDESMVAKAEYEPPRNETERKIVKIWAQVLEIEEQRLSIHDNFFELGGHSLKAMEITVKSNGEFPLAKIFQYPTPRELAESMINDTGTDAQRLLYAFTRTDSQIEVSIVCFPYAGGNAVNFKLLADAISQLTDKVALYGVELPGHDFSHQEIPLKPIDEIARQCVAEIQDRIKTPVIIWGHCSGTAPALAVARLLEENGSDLRYISLGGRVMRPPRRQKRRSLVSSLLSFFTPGENDAAENEISDDEIRKWLIEITGFTEFAGAGEKESAFIVKNFRHDAESANRYFEEYFKSRPPGKLKSPIYNIISKDDPLTKDYKKSHKNWRRFSNSLELITLEHGAHYFVKTKAAETARIIIDLWNKHK
jgi:amino acid adenylation domain-containing protein